MPQVGFEPEVPANERPQTHALDRAATGIGILGFYEVEIIRGVSICVPDAVLVGYLNRKWQTRKQISFFFFQICLPATFQKGSTSGFSAL